MYLNVTYLCFVFLRITHNSEVVKSIVAAIRNDFDPAAVKGKL